MENIFLKQSGITGCIRQKSRSWKSNLLKQRVLNNPENLCLHSQKFLLRKNQHQGHSQRFSSRLLGRQPNRQLWLIPKDHHGTPRHVVKTRLHRPTLNPAIHLVRKSRSTMIVKDLPNLLDRSRRRVIAGCHGLHSVDRTGSHVRVLTA